MPKHTEPVGQGTGERATQEKRGGGERGEGEGALETCRAVPLSLWWRTDACMCKGDLPGTKNH